jgi:hypothetical protein
VAFFACDVEGCFAVTGGCGVVYVVWGVEKEEEKDDKYKRRAKER